MILQAWHTFVLEVSSIVLGRTVQAQPGSMGSVGAQPFSGLSRDALLGSRFHSGLLYISMFLHPSFPVSWLVSQSLSQKSLRTAWCWTHRGWLQGRHYWADAECLVSSTHTPLGTVAKIFNLCFIRPEDLASHGLRVNQVLFWQTPSGLSCAFYDRNKGLSFCKVLPSLQRTLNLIHSDHWVPGYRSLWLRLLSLAGQPDLGRLLVVPNLSHLKMEATVF